MLFDPHALKLFIDGSCFKNPGGRSGFAAWVEYPVDWDRPNEQLQQVGFHESTNQRMELRACIWAHEWIRRNVSPRQLSRVQIVTDSKYVHDFWRYAEHWRRNGWRLSTGRPTENADLWKEFLSIRNKMPVRVDIQWTPGKKAEITKAVDKAAKQAAKQPLKVDRGFVGGKVGRTRGSVSGTAALFPANGQEAVIRIYHTMAYKRRAGENRIKFQVFSETKKEFIEKFLAYAAPETGSLLHRQRVYRVRFNDNSDYPSIVEVPQEFLTTDAYLDGASSPRTAG